MTLGKLLANISSSTPSFTSLTVNDLLSGLLPPTSYPWQNVKLTKVPLSAHASATGTDTLYARVNTQSPTGTTPTVPVTLTFTLPPGFSYVTGSALRTGSAMTAPTVNGQQVIFGGGHNLSVFAGETSPVIQISVKAGTGLGLAKARATVSVTTVTASAQTSTATMDVVDGRAPAYHSAATPATVTTGSLNFGYITPASNVDYWKVKVTQGDELSLQLSNLPADFDLTLFAPATQQLQGTPSHRATGTNDATASLTGQIHQQTTGTQGIPLTPPLVNYRLNAYSDNRGHASETIQTPPLSAGTYLVQVSGYNGDSSTKPYLLRATEVSSGITTSCPGISYPHSVPAATLIPGDPGQRQHLVLDQHPAFRRRLRNSR